MPFEGIPGSGNPTYGPGGPPPPITPPYLQPPGDTFDTPYLDPQPGATPISPGPYLGGPSVTPTPAGGGSQAQNEIAKIIIEEARAAGIPDNYLWIPLTIAWGESGWDPNRVGDNGHSVGLFQLYAPGGVGDGMTVEERQNPRTNARRMMPAIAQAISEGNGKLGGFQYLFYVWDTALRPQTDQSTELGRQVVQNMRIAYQSAVSGRVPWGEEVAQILNTDPYYVGGFGSDAEIGPPVPMNQPGALPSGDGDFDFTVPGYGGGSGGGYTTVPGAPDLSGYQLLGQLYEGILPWVQTYLGLVTGDRAQRAQGATNILNAMSNAASTALAYAELKKSVVPGLKHAPGWAPGGPAEALYKKAGKEFTPIEAPQINEKVPDWVHAFGDQPIEPLLQALLPPAIDASGMMSDASSFAEGRAGYLPPHLADLPALAADMYHNPPPMYLSNNGGSPSGLPSLNDLEVMYLMQNPSAMQQYFASQFDPNFYLSQIGGINPAANPAIAGVPGASGMPYIAPNQAPPGYSGGAPLY